MNAAEIKHLSNYNLIMLWERWSEEFYCAGFMGASPDTVERFLEYLQTKVEPVELEDYEREMIVEVRKQCS
jgi:hypothetical protein